MAVYKLPSEICKIPENTPIWACVYRGMETFERVLNVQPVLVIIICRTFYPLRKDGRPVYSKGVTFFAREYADTFEECVELYNDAVQRHIEMLEYALSQSRKDFIRKKQGKFVVKILKRKGWLYGNL